MDRRGSYFRLKTRPTTSDLLTLDAQKFAKQVGFARPTYSTWYWKWTNGRESWIEYEVKPGQGVRLVYKCSSQSFDYLVSVVTTPCHFGGVRYWWACPRCSRRCRILYGGALFVCRQCSGAYYETQVSKDLAIRIDNELRRLRAKLGAKSLSKRSMPPKPKGMHWRTYSRLAKCIFNLQQAEEMAGLLSVIAYSEMIGMSKPGQAAALKAQLRWLMKQEESEG